MAALTSRRGATAELLAPLLRGVGSLVELLARGAAPLAALAALPPLLLRHATAPECDPAAAAAAIHAAAACLPIFCKADLVTLLRSAAAALAHRYKTDGVPVGACRLAAALLTLELKEQPEVVERGGSGRWAVPQLAPPRGAPGGSGQLGTPRTRPSHWNPSHWKPSSSAPPSKLSTSLRVHPSGGGGRARAPRDSVALRCGPGGGGGGGGGGGSGSGRRRRQRASVGLAGGGGACRGGRVHLQLHRAGGGGETASSAQAGAARRAAAALPAESRAGRGYACHAATSNARHVATR